MTQPTKAREHYLLIDDDLSFRLTVRRAAERSGISFHTAASLNEFEDLKTLDVFDVIFVDYDLDDMTGFEVVELLNANLANKPIILVSGTNRPYQDKLGKLPNIIGFVSKWANSNEFIKKSMQLIQNHHELEGGEVGKITFSA